jgi:HSP20 family protein
MAIDFSSLYDIPKEFDQAWERMLRRDPIFRHRAEYPLVNIIENESGYNIDVSIPGVDPADLSLEISERNISISGERKSQEGKYYRQERGSGSFQRVFSLNAPIDRDKAEAEFKDGILRVRLPKSAASLPRKITIESKYA